MRPGRVPERSPLRQALQGPTCVNCWSILLVWLCTRRAACPTRALPRLRSAPAAAVARRTVSWLLPAVLAVVMRFVVPPHPGSVCNCGRLYTPKCLHVAKSAPRTPCVCALVGRRPQATPDLTSKCGVEDNIHVAIAARPGTNDANSWLSCNAVHARTVRRFQGSRTGWIHPVPGTNQFEPEPNPSGHSDGRWHLACTGGPLLGTI